jgi:hypothetical protein
LLVDVLFSLVVELDFLIYTESDGIGFSQCHQIPYKSRNQVPLQEKATLQPTTIPGPPQMRTSLLRYVAAYTKNDRSAVKTNHGKSISKA